MSIFQKSVLQKHLHNLNKEKVEKAFQIFQSNYNSAKIAQIKTLKEEEYQDGFLRDIFVDVLGYTLRPEENYNLQREFKNQTDGKKADAAILTTSGQVPLSVATAIAVIELKSTKTKDLTKVTQQAFNYKNNQPECKYVITSNFQKLRFYINYANEYEEFDLFTLQKKDFEVLYLLLNKNSIFENLPLKIKEETKFHEQEISNKLYKDYSRFKRKLYENLIKNHPESNKLTLFKKSQKLVDRFLFILFAEDSGLLPPNSITSIIETYYKLIELDAKKPLYDIFKQYFGYMNIGRKGKTNAGNIPAYNGGLFYKDALLDSLKIEDTILIEDLRNLSEYDFNTEVDVNILGHIFEHSLNEIEEVYNTTKGDVPLSVNKRKKDGVFYTPKYITQYIVENTIGALCNEKRIALEIEEIEFDSTFRTKKETLSEKGKKLYNKLKTYKEWLISLKIIDPACGSGAFLNQALNFLIEEHTSIDDIIEDLTNSSLSLRLFDIDKTILENNLFGVDINEESIEIAQLSLWLRTAQKGRKLSQLNNNIKRGNSLIDDPKIAGENAFNWNTEFKEIMDNGGFDCVIGNPPYVQIQSMGDLANDLKNQHFKTFEKTGDLYCLFYELGTIILKEKGLLGFITSNKWMRAKYGKSLRNYFANATQPLEIIDLGAGIFESATVDSNILIFEKNSETTKKPFVAIDLSKEKTFLDFSIYKNRKVEIKITSDENWIISNPIELKIKEKAENKGIKLKDWDVKIYRGILTGFNDAFIIDTATKEALIKQNPNSAEIIKPILRGRDIKAYGHKWSGLWLIATFPALKLDIDKYPAVKEYLESFGKRIHQIGGKESRKKTGNKWFETQDQIGYYDEFEKDKIVWASVGLNEYSYVEKEYFILDTNYFAVGLNKYHLALLNSKLIIKWFIEKTDTLVGTQAYRHYKYNFEKIPIPPISKESQQPFLEKADKMLVLNKELQNKSNRFINRITDNFEIEKISKKLHSFYNFDFKTLIAELKKQKIVVSLKQQEEWQDYFESYKTEINQLQTEIKQTDKEIDTMVYKLYGLSNEEIKIVENS